jgi:toxin ETX/toxin MTX2
MIRTLPLRKHTPDSTTKTYTHTVANTEGWKFDLSEQISFHAEADFIFGFGGSSTTTFTFEYSTSTTDTQTHTEQQVISWSAEIPVPNRKRVEATVTLMEAVYNPRFEAIIEISGTAQFVYRKDGKLCVYRTTPGAPFAARPV